MVSLILLHTTSNAKANALDVKVFRGFSNSAKEYVAEQHLLDIDISETQAVDIIMKIYHDNGDYIYTQCHPSLWARNLLLCNL